MLSVYKVFQLILGIILSVFILTVLIQYSSNYSFFGETKQRLTVLDNIKTSAAGVLSAGNPLVFKDSSFFDLSSCFPSFRDGESSITCGFGSVSPLSFPFLPYFAPKERLFLDSGSIDYGWWRERFVTALPEMRVIFNPLEDSDRIWNTMESVVSVLPDTSGFPFNITFGFCDGDSVSDMLCNSGQPCEKTDFLGLLSNYRSSLNKCAAHLSGYHFLVTLSDSCGPDIADGVCVKPVTETSGYVYAAGRAEPFVYGDGLDILSVMAGESSAGMGKLLYDYKNSLMSERLSLAAKIMKERSSLLKRKHPDRDCRTIYGNLETALNGIESATEDSRNSPSQAESLNEKLSEAGSLYSRLRDKGCEI